MFSHLQTIYDCFHSSTVQSWVVPKYTLWPAKSKMFTSYLLTEKKFANLCLQGVIPLLSYHFSHCYSASVMLIACSFMLVLATVLFYILLPFCLWIFSWIVYDFLFHMTLESGIFSKGSFLRILQKMTLL